MHPFLLTAVLCLRSDQGVQIAELKQMIRSAATEALVCQRSISDPERKCGLGWDIGSALAGPFDNEARTALREAWSLASQHPEKCGLTQMRVAQLLGVLDPAEGLRLLPEIKDKYWRDYATESFYDGMALRHPELARAHLVKDHQKLYEAVESLCSVRMDMGVQFLKSVKGADTEDISESVAQNMNPQDAAKFLSQFEVPSPRYPLCYWQARHPNPTGPELEAEAGTMKDVYDRVELELEAGEAYKDSDPKRAAAIADEICDEAAGHGPKPVLEKPRLMLDWNYMLLPDIAFADTPKVRWFIDHCGPEGMDSMERVAAWSRIDIKRAIRLADEMIKVDPKSVLGAHGLTSSSGYREFIKNLIPYDPEQAAQCLNRIRHSDDQGGEPTMLFVEAVDMIEKLWSKYPAEVTRFCVEPTRWSALFHGNPRSVVEAFRLNSLARSRPFGSERPLRRLRAVCPAGLLYELDPRFAATVVIVAVAKCDPTRAIRIARVLSDPSDRILALTSAADRLAEAPWAVRKPLLDAALHDARCVSDPFQRAQNLTRVAETAQAAWRRLQPWPTEAENSAK